MRKLSVLLFTLLSLSTAKAEVITQDAARQKAVDFVTNRLKAGKRAASRGIQNLEIAESRNAFHVFNIGEVDGFVVVSGDDRMPDILGYSDNGNFDGKSIPDNLRGWLQGYERQYEYLKTHPDAKLTSRGSDSRKPIAPMLECQWNQGSPFNDQCPDNCPTDCSATAMAQIMYYHQWPKQTTKPIPSYTSRTNGYEIPSIEVTTIDWENMLPTYDYSSSEKSRKAVSTLMKLCGAAVHMDYDASGSRASADSQFAEYFGYEKDVTRIVREGRSEDMWNSIIYNELKNQRPVLYDGYPIEIDKENGIEGHAFVVDGYDDNDYFHINFGWGGWCDGFYLLSVITPGSDFSYYQSAVVRLQPTSSTKPKPYMTLDNGTLTFCYDSDRDKSKVQTFAYSPSSKNYDILSQVTHVIISPSFANYPLFTQSSLFSGNNKLETIEGLGNLNTTYLTDMSNMFEGCSALTSLDVSNFNTSNVTDMESMFYGCSGLTSLDVSNFNTSNVTSMYCMFDGCSGLTSLDVSNFSTSNVTSIYGMFWGCSGLTSLDLSNFDTSNVTDMGSMFYGCFGLTSLDVSKFNTSNVTYMGAMFSGCSGLTSLDVSKFNTSSVIEIGGMFGGCSGLTSLDVSKFNTSNVTNMWAMFRECCGLTSLDVSNFNTSNVTDMGSMFSGCSGLTSLDVSKFNTSNVTNMGSMFSGCSGLTSLDVSKFNTSNVTNMWAMFRECCGLTSLDVSKFNTSNVIDMESMFDGCSGLTSLDVSNFDTSNVTYMHWMFCGCSELKTIYAKNDWNTNKVENGDYMFWGCSELVGGKGTEYNYSYSDHTYARIDGGESSPGYFTVPGLKGDCNGDGTVDKADIVEIENYIMGRPSAIFQEYAADMNYDGVINAADIVLLINMVQK